MEVLQSFPDLILAMALSMAFGTGLQAVIFAIAITRIPFGGRVIRSVALSIREMSTWRRDGHPAPPRAHQAFHVLPQCVRLTWCWRRRTWACHRHRGRPRFLGVACRRRRPRGATCWRLDHRRDPPWWLVLFPAWPSRSRCSRSTCSATHPRHADPRLSPAFLRLVTARRAPAAHPPPSPPSPPRRSLHDTPSDPHAGGHGRSRPRRAHIRACSRPRRSASPTAAHQDAKIPALGRMQMQAGAAGSRARSWGGRSHHPASRRDFIDLQLSAARRRAPDALAQRVKRLASSSTTSGRAGLSDAGAPRRGRALPRRVRHGFGRTRADARSGARACARSLKLPRCASGADDLSERDPSTRLFFERAIELFNARASRSR